MANPQGRSAGDQSAGDQSAGTGEARAVISQIEALYRSGRYDEAIARLAALPESADQLRLLGLCRLRQGRGADALALLTRARALAPDDPWAALHLGVGLQALGRQGEAVEHFRAAAALLPQDPAPCINLAAALLALGQVKAALQAASDGCFRAPQMAEAHYTYGLAWQAAGEPARAEAAFATAVRLKPAFADAWVNLGLNRYRRGDVEGAKAAMRSAIQAQPGHRAAHGNLGAFLRLTGQSEAAEQLLRGLLARDPDAIEARLNLAADLLSEERSAEALALLDVPAPADPRARQHWGLQRSLALVQLRRPAEAQAVLDQLGPVSADTAPLVLWRRVLLAMAKGDARTAAAVAIEMEAALEAAGEASVPEHRIMARYDLAKFWSQLNAPSRAMANWRHGHAELRRFQPFSRERYQAFVDESLTAFSAERLREGPRASDTDPAPVFIVGMPRSGTTLAEQILGAHGAMHGAGERNALSDAVYGLGGDVDSAEAVRRIAALDQPALERAARSYLPALHALAPEAERIVDKMPGNFRHLGLAALMLPGARVIHCARDPRDIGLSIFTFRFHGHHSYAHDLGDLGWYIGQHDRLMAHWKAVAPIPITTVRLSDWVEDFQGTLTRLLAFLDMPFDPACERFYEGQGRVRTVSRAQVRQPVNAKGLGRWRAYADDLQPLIAELDRAGSLEAWR